MSQESHEGRPRAQRSRLPVLRRQVLELAAERFQGPRQCAPPQVEALQVPGGGMRLYLRLQIKVNPDIMKYLVGCLLSLFGVMNMIR